ncbi:MAG: restriction endonuclease [Alphaproteobacteria bacterium]|nr:restriction endonuclease [Alphaproteobacteria bacterium]
MFAIQDFKNYRQEFGFTSKDGMKKFLSAKDISPSVNFSYVNDLNTRLRKIISNLYKMDYFLDVEIEKFLSDNLDKVYQTILNENLLPLMNNQGRRPEQVYFNWMRGHLICQFFKPYTAKILDVNIDAITDVGDDDFTSINTFKRTAKADLELIKESQIYRIEVQSGFQDINDVKQHKVIEAKRIFEEDNKQTILMHFDLFNGQVGLILLNNIAENDQNWITRQQMEGQTVFNISQNKFYFMLNKEKIEPINDIEEFLSD